jgi:multidrug efflux pump subunit AcrB
VPLLAKLTLLNGKKLNTERRESRMAQIYRRALSWSLDHRKTVLLLSTLMLLASLLLIPLVGTSFLPADKDKAIQVEVKMPSGTALEVTNDKAKEIEDQLKTYSEVQVISTTVGNLRGQLAGDGSIGSTNRVNMFVSLDPDTKMDAFLKRVRSDLEGLKEDAELNVHEVNSMIPTSGEIVAVVKGDRMQDIRKVAEALTQRMEKVDDLVNVTNNLSEQKELVNIKVDQEKAAKEGLSAAQVAMSIRGLLEADTVTELENGSQVQEVKLGLERKDLASLKKLKDVRIMGATGNLVRLGDVAKVEKVKGPVTIQKENGQSYATVTGDITTSDSGAVSREVRQIIDGMDLPAGVTVSLSGETEEMDKSFAQLGVAMIVAVLAVYLVMIVAFGEATAPFTIMFSLPYAVIGGLVGLWISGQPISVSGLIGALMLIGIVVTNAIVLIDRVQQQRRRGLDVRSALLEAGGTRLRPILMTAFATIFALLPLGLGYGDGSLISQGLAVVVIGGLTSSTFLTLFIVPIMYSILTGLKERVLRKRAGSEV